MNWIWVLVISTIGLNPGSKDAGKFNTSEDCYKELQRLKKEDPKIIGRCEQRAVFKRK